MSVSPIIDFGVWEDMSIFLEMKPKSDLASLFIDVPPGFREKSNANAEGEERRKIKYDDINVVDVTSSTIRIGAPPSAALLIKKEREALRNANHSQPIAIKKGRERSNSVGSSSCSPKSSTSPSSSSSNKKNKKKNQKKEADLTQATRFGATLKNATINEKSVCSPTWADNNPRLFMCKVQVEPESGPLVQKTNHRIAKDICKIERLEAFAARAHPKIHCGKCRLQLLSEEYIMTIGVLPDDDWLSTSQSVDYYCRESCGAACDPDRHNHEKKKPDDQKAAEEWLPNEKKVMISYANSVVDKLSVIDEHIKIDGNVVKCAGCCAQLGKIQKNHPNIINFNHISARMTSGIKKIAFVEKTNLESLSVYFSQLIMNACESTGSSKIVLRTLNRVPQCLIWVLDQYIVIANGKLRGLLSEDDEGDLLHPFPAIKLLYKVFNQSNASTDPRANGEDTSAGIVDLPLPCCQLLIEMLLRSCLRSPPACRAVGQFHVGYLKIDDNI